MSQSGYNLIINGNSTPLTFAVAQAKASIETIGTSAQTAGYTASTSADGVTMKIRLLGMEAQQTGQSMTMMLSSFRALSMAIFPMQIGLFYLSMYQSNLMSAEARVNNVESAQERLNEAIRKYGAGSSQAISAARQLENAQINYQRAVQASQIMTISMGLQVVSMGASFLSVIPQLKQLIETLKTYNIVQTIASSLSGGVGWAKLIAGGVIAGASIYGINALMNSAAPSPNVNVAVNTDNTDIIQAYLRRTGGNTINAAG